MRLPMLKRVMEQRELLVAASRTLRVAEATTKDVLAYSKELAMLLRARLPEHTCNETCNAICETCN